MTDSIRTDGQTYQADEQLLKDKIIAVTGAGDGIGKCAALTFAKHGATIVLMGRTTAKLEAVYDAIEAAGYPQAAIYPINFEGAVEKDYQDMCNAIDDAFGRLDGILHNASELGERTPIGNYTSEVWQRVMQVNVFAPYLMTKNLLPLLERSDSASIVFTGSSVGHKGRAYWGAYAASKAATENLMETLADEFDETSNIRVNSINPGATRTNMRATAYPAENPASVKAPEDIMSSYLFLFGNHSSDLSGISFNAQ